MRTHKEDPIRVSLTVGGNRIEYPGKSTTKTANITTFKIHTNYVISTRGAIYAGWDIGNYYLETPMGRSEYFRIHIILMPPDIIEHYNLNELVNQYGLIYMDIIRGMYGLPQAGILEKLTQTTFKQPWIISDKTKTSIVAKCVETYFIHIVSGRFLNWLCWTGACRSSGECTKNVLWKYHNRLGRKHIVRYNNEMGW